MPAFRIYNIQLLPLDTGKTDEVGLVGYKKLFEELNITLTKHIKEKNVIQYSDALIHDTYISPFTVHSINNGTYSYGEFIKFHKADMVLDFYTNATLYNSDDKASAVSNIYLFRFIFDHENHRLAIEEQGTKLPDAMRFTKSLEYFLKPVADEHFPKHTLTVNLVSEGKKLNQVLKEAKGFSKVYVKLTFANGSTLSDTLKELKEKNVHRVEHTTSSERGSVMPELTNYMRALLDNAPKYGEASLTYYKSVKKNATDRLKKYSYKTKNFPKKLNLRQQADETNESFIDRVWFKLKNSFADSN